VSKAPPTRSMTVIAQDPSIKRHGRILRTTVQVPLESLRPGPEGYRVRVIDYDGTTGTLYRPVDLNGKDRYANASDDVLLRDPGFHAQNVYALVMATLGRFEYALGRRVGWSIAGHQLKVAPHAFAAANAFYSERDEALCFGYFPAQRGMVFTCLARDVVAHETAHAILDGLRSRYTDPSSPDQAAFHEGFADIVAILSVFGSADVVDALLPRGSNANTVPKLGVENLKQSSLLKLAEQMGQEMSPGRAGALRESAQLPPGDYLDRPDRQDPHARGEVLVAAVLRAFLKVWAKRIESLGTIAKGQVDRQRVVEDGAGAAKNLLTMVIRSIDYAPPVDLQFGDFLSALLTADRETFPDDTLYGYRTIIRECFDEYGIQPASDEGGAGVWEPFTKKITLDHNHFESLQTNPDEVFRFVWENRDVLELYPGAYCRVESVRPCLRHGADGFFLRETVAEYTEILTLQPGEISRVRLKAPLMPKTGRPSRGRRKATYVEVPPGLPKDEEVRLYGGGALIFDQFGQLKYHIKNPLNSTRQSARLRSLVEGGAFDRSREESHIAQLHLQRAARNAAI
jgi:hypothetical protein